MGEFGTSPVPADQRSEAFEAMLLGPLGGRLYHSNFRTKVRWPELGGLLGWPGAVP